jgi:hypothetical protein
VSDQTPPVVTSMMTKAGVTFERSFSFHHTSSILPLKMRPILDLRVGVSPDGSGSESVRCLIKSPFLMHSSTAKIAALQRANSLLDFFFLKM